LRTVVAEAVSAGGGTADSGDAPAGLLFDAPGIGLPVWIDFTDPRGGYTIPPLAGKSFKLALDQHGRRSTPDLGSRTVTGEETAAARAFLAERFPALA
jgi:hypothetical protein